jgi:hypothetical protein
MGVVISKPAINIREQLTELKAQQGYEERQFHFDDLVTNGTFDTDVSGWTLTSAGSSQSVVSGKLRITIGGGESNARSSQTITTVIGKVYVYSVDAFQETSSVNPQFKIGTTLGGSQILTIDCGPADGTFTGTFVATTTTTYVTVQNNGGGDGAYVDFDNVSVYTSDGTDVAFTMPKGWKPLHVFEDGALQREGSAYDYTVEYDGFNYIVKETVAPVASSSTTVIGVRA